MLDTYKVSCSSANKGGTTVPRPFWMGAFLYFFRSMIGCRTAAQAALLKNDKSLSKRSKQSVETLQRAGDGGIPARVRLLNGLTRGFLKKHVCLSMKTRVSAVTRIGYRFACIHDASFSVSEKDEKMILFEDEVAPRSHTSSINTFEMCL